MSPQPPAAQPADPALPAAGRAGRLRRVVRRRPLLSAVAAAVMVFALLVAVIGTAGAVLDEGGSGDAGGRWQGPLDGAGPATPPASQPPTATPGPQSVSLSATGDIILGDAGSLPANDGEGFFDGVADALAADLVMGNLEEPLTADTGYRKCGEDSEGCHAFRAPPGYADHLREAGFELLNLANNHGYDFGPQGHANTQAALAERDIAHTGDREQVTVVDAAGVPVAVVGFSPYSWTNQLTDLSQARDVVSQAAGQAELVVVQVHLGAEGADATRVRPGTETFFGENRGDPMAFSRAVIDAGADLVVGHGPHVLRGLEFYQGRLIAYSLGNFAGGGGSLSSAGRLGLGAVLKVSLLPDGGFAGGEFVSTHMYDGGLPEVDSQQRSLQLVRDLTARDFPDAGAQLGPDGEISPPSGG